MRRNCRAELGIALLGIQLAACAPAPLPSNTDVSSLAGNSDVVVREDLSGRFIALVGPKAQIDPPYLGIADTNVSRLRSFLDRRTGETAHQLYVAASYDGNHDWTAAHDAAGRELQFIPISRLLIACEEKQKCAYAEEFAAKLPESELVQNTGGFLVTFSDHSGNTQSIPVSAAQVTAQLAALADLHKTMAAASPPATAAH
jgi:hypothetical protein